MRAIVVYESAFGNTRTIAEAVAEGLRGSGEVEVHTVAEATPAVIERADLLIVGGPTHVHGMASRTSMKAAADDADKHPGVHLEPGVEGEVLRNWFNALPPGRQAAAAAFDTRLARPQLLTGAAAKGIGHRLTRHGYRLVADPESFTVDDSHGPLHAGELERARDWGKSLALAAAGR